MSDRYARLARRAGDRCEYCRAPERLSNEVFELDHVYPQARGGSGEESNLAFACPFCNGRKSDLTTARDEETGEDEFLFNPRMDRWAEHFRFDADSGRIEGLTAIGRATVRALDMNHPRQLTARLIWLELRWYP